MSDITLAHKRYSLSHAKKGDARILRMLRCVFFAVLFSALYLLTGCATTRTASVTAPSGNAIRLQSLPDAPAAAKAAPVFTLDALNTIAELESQVKELKVKP